MPATLAYRSMQLFVPQANPMDATLNIDGEAMTHFFARPTPPVVNGKPGRSTVAFKVSKDRKEIKTDIGHSVFSHFQNSEPRSVSSKAEELRHSWTFQAGPFAEHTVVISKESKSSQLIHLEVDGTVLVHCGPEDIESPPGVWECPFRLNGERIIEWEVYESDGDGNTLDTTAKVIEKSKYSHDCTVRIDLSTKDLITAKLYVNDITFQELAQDRGPTNEAPINISEHGLRGLGMLVPYKISKDAKIPGTGFMAKVNKALQKAEQAAPAGLFGLFSCCAAPKVVTDENTELVAKPVMSQ